MHIIDYGYDDAEQHDIRLELEIDNEDRKLVTADPSTTVSTWTQGRSRTGPNR